MVFGLVEIDRYAGNLLESCTKFVRHDMTFFELSLDSDVMQTYPLETKGIDSVNFYHRYLQSTNRLDNDMCSTVLTQRQFDNCNFLVVQNFDEGETGHLTLKLKFARPLDKKLMLLYMCISKKQIFFDNYYNVVKQ